MGNEFDMNKAVKNLHDLQKAGEAIFNPNMKLANEKQAQNMATATYMQHDCHAWNVQGYTSSPDYKCATCRVCGRITGFQWRSWWMRVRSVFTGEPRITPVVDPDP